ncbi:MAG: hypothetical protein JWO96_64 [Candidatus Saccharibacteria bacterium]|nr:hypothetical protein [Candidatus Saccharibacteria bacterium]
MSFTPEKDGLEELPHNDPRNHTTLEQNDLNTHSPEIDRERMEASLADSEESE